MDRRNGGDRRTAPRYPVNISVYWESPKGRQKGTVNDISTEGCFVLCSGEVEDGDTVKLFFPLSDGIKVQILGEVANHIFEIGFGVRFVDLSAAQQGFVARLIDSVKKD